MIKMIGCVLLLCAYPPRCIFAMAVGREYVSSICVDTQNTRRALTVLLHLQRMCFKTTFKIVRMFSVFRALITKPLLFPGYGWFW